ncbi:MAG: formate dehydrogenase family accessory protein FdhD [Pirellula sp.]|nr:formate dehydrogenase family accessory protein FdhD [Pirellula sp.]
MSLYHPGVTTVAIASVSFDGVLSDVDELSVEEPLEIVVRLARDEQVITRSVAVTMRTPGADAELAAGFLLTEGIIQSEREISDIQVASDNKVCVALSPSSPVDFARLDRQSFVSSSCGVCGKRSIAAVFALKHQELRIGEPRIDSEVVHGLAQAQRAAQPTFARTGGLHAAALFDADGALLSLYEDVGRHNALDKLIGSQLLSGGLPLAERILFLSGRASFELVQKAALAGIPIVAAVGAPSSLAVALARQCSMTLLGFVRDSRFNVYADAGRLRETPAGLFAGS